MGIKYSPKVGQILMCNFHGFKEPEMVKDRPVIVVKTNPSGYKLATVVCLSTKKPYPVQPHHMEIEDSHLPRTKFFSKGTTWLKGDMIYSVSFDRLSYVSLGSVAGKRQYFQNRLSRDVMKEVYSCILHGLNIGFLAEHL